MTAKKSATPEEAPAPEGEAQEQPNGVLIVRVEEENGAVNTDTVPLGDVKPTEVQTVIELGLGVWRKKVGLDA